MPKLPFSLDQFGDYEPQFLSHKVIHLDRKLTDNEKNFYKNFKEFRSKQENMSKDFSKELEKKLGQSALVNNRSEKSSINRPPSASTSSYLDIGSSSKQPIAKRHMLASLHSAGQPKKALHLEHMHRLTDSVRKTNEQNPLSLLRFQPKNVTQINRIYLLSYFRSGSSFLGDLLQQHYRTFYQFEPLHFRSVASRLPSNDSRTDSSVALVLQMLNQCDFHSRSTANYLAWISKYDNRFLLSWNRFLYSLCRYNLTHCSDETFVTTVCNLAEQRVTKLTRLNLADLIKGMFADRSLEEHIRTHLMLGDEQLTFRIYNETHSSGSSTASGDKTTNDKQTKVIDSKVNESKKSEDKPKQSTIVDVEPIKIIYLVRDPRAIFSSRQYLSWCKNRACTNIDRLCDEMNQDFRVFESLYANSSRSNSVLTLTGPERYPIRLFLVRFELVALDPLRSTSELFRLINLPFKENIRRFVYSHTAANLDGKEFKTPFKKWYLNKVSNDPHSTKRNSTKIPFDWIHKLNWSKIDEIQTKCRYSMDRLGYKPITAEQFKNIPKNLTELLLTRKNEFTLF